MSGWAGVSLREKHSGRFRLTETYVRERRKNISASKNTVVLIDIERLFVWKAGGALFAYIHQSLCE